MSTPIDATLNGHAATVSPTPGRAALSPAARRAGRRWILFPVGLIVGQMGIVGGMMYVASSDPSFAVEPNYYEKALAWDATAAQKAANERLAWRTTVGVSRGDAGGSELVVRLVNSDGTALDGAKVQAEVFASTRARERTALLLEARGDGTYASPAPISRAGLWECRLVIDRGPERFTTTARLEVRAEGSAR
jgi:nitrogen fixation protein FixH